MVRINEFSFLSANGTDRIYAAEWLPENGVPRAVLQIAHGIVEYIGRYDEFARFMAENGVAVVGNDHLGHYKSASNKEDLGFFAEKNGWQTAVSDMHTLYLTESDKFKGVPYFLLGHSMGSFLARTYIIEHRGNLAGCILSGTGNQSSVLCNAGLAAAALEKARIGVRGRSKLLRSLMFGAYNNRFKPTRTGSDWISRDTEIVDKYVKDEYCTFIPTVGLISDMLGGIKYITDTKNIGRVEKDLPIYLFSGEDDPVGDYGKGVKLAYEAYKNAGCGDVEMKLYPGGRHEMLNEINREEVYADILTWISKKLS